MWSGAILMADPRMESRWTPDPGFLIQDFLIQGPRRSRFANCTFGWVSSLGPDDMVPNRQVQLPTWGSGRGAPRDGAPRAPSLAFSGTPTDVLPDGVVLGGFSPPLAFDLHPLPVRVRRHGSRPRGQRPGGACHRLQHLFGRRPQHLLGHRPQHFP